MIFLSCLGTRPSGSGPAVQEHHQDGANELHPQLPQGKSNVLIVFPGVFEKYLKVYIYLEPRS